VAWVALLVQFLGTVIGVFSPLPAGRAGPGRYMRPGRRAGRRALLLLADHWLLLIAGLGLVGQALHGLLCFYPDRPFAQLAAHKKRQRPPGRCAAAAGGRRRLATVGSGSSRARWPGAHGLSLAAVALALAVIVRTALCRCRAGCCR
jgi:NAD(P)H-quinone oxidoreductase subunit 5